MEKEVREVQEHQLVQEGRGVQEYQDHLGVLGCQEHQGGPLNHLFLVVQQERPSIQVDQGAPVGRVVLVVL